MKTIYRIEHRTRGTGMWYDEERNNRDYMNTNQPMPRYDDIFNAKGKVWYNATLDKTNFKQWFNEKFTKELLDNDYIILELRVTEWEYYSNHVIYTKEGVIERRELNFCDIYEYNQVRGIRDNPLNLLQYNKNS